MKNISGVWDYDKAELEKRGKGRILPLERAVNYGAHQREKIPLSEVKLYWNKLNLFTKSIC